MILQLVALIIWISSEAGDLIFYFADLPHRPPPPPGLITLLSNPTTRILEAESHSGDPPLSKRATGDPLVETPNMTTCWVSYFGDSYRIYRACELVPDSILFHKERERDCSEKSLSRGYNHKNPLIFAMKIPRTPSQIPSNQNDKYGRKIKSASLAHNPHQPIFSKAPPPKIIVVWWCISFKIGNLVGCQIVRGDPHSSWLASWRLSFIILLISSFAEAWAELINCLLYAYYMLPRSSYSYCLRWWWWWVCSRNAIGCSNCSTELSVWHRSHLAINLAGLQSASILDDDDMVGEDGYDDDMIWWWGWGVLCII